MSRVLDRAWLREASVLTAEQHAPRVTAITDWLIQQGLLRSTFGTILEGYCERLVEIGVPLWRGYISARTLHPRVRGTGCSWRADEGIRSELYIYSPQASEDYLKSPFRWMLEAGQSQMRLDLSRDEPVPFPVVERLRQQGATDYLAQIVGFGVDGQRSGETGVLASWTTRDPRSFAERDVAILEHMSSRLALALQARLGHEIAVNLLDTYVGPEAGRRILDGEIRRGMLEAIPAVVFYADLRGFTAMADQTPHDELVEMLNAYFDCLVPVLVAHGGYVLKFLGDGLLATFPLAGRAPAEVCETALDAAAEALGCVQQLSGERLETGKPLMELDLVLHLGEVFWGNVGSADRLDFTVIGPAVNEASRIEALCAQHERNLLISETFARAATSSSARLVSIGRYALRGVRSAQSLYTLDGL
jgi:adenylate cyclase